MFFHIVGKFLLTAMCGTEDYKTRLKQYHLQFRKIFSNFFLRTFLCSVFSYFSVLPIYVIKEQILFITFFTFKYRQFTANVLVCFSCLAGTYFAGRCSDCLLRRLFAYHCLLLFASS